MSVVEVYLAIRSGALTSPAGPLGPFFAIVRSELERRQELERRYANSMTPRTPRLPAKHEVSLLGVEHLRHNIEASINAATLGGLVGSPR